MPIRPEHPRLTLDEMFESAPRATWREFYNLPVAFVRNIRPGNPTEFEMTIQVKTEIVFETEARDVEGIGVTVIVTLYNYEAYIENALDSVLRQSYSNIELIVVDDASQDSSQVTARTWFEQNGARFSQAKLLSHFKNYGPSQARNTAFANATNEYVFVLDADNEIYSDAIAKLLSACISAGAETAYSQIEKFGEESGPGSGDFWNPALLAQGNFIDAMALIKKSAWMAAGGYSHFRIPGWEDYDLWCKFVELGFRGVFVPELLCRYRVHRSSMLNQTTNPNVYQLKLEMMERHPWLRLDHRNKYRRIFDQLLRLVRPRGWWLRLHRFLAQLRHAQD